MTNGNWMLIVTFGLVFGVIGSFLGFSVSDKYINGYRELDHAIEIKTQKIKCEPYHVIGILAGTTIGFILGALLAFVIVMIV